MRVAMIGHKDFPSRAGGVETVVSELAPHLARRGYQVTVYNRGKRRGCNHGFCQGVEFFRTFTLQREGLNALIYSFTATVHALFRGYDLIHYHALGPSVMIPLARLSGAGIVATVHGLDWQRAKWSKAASAYLRLGERLIARYADEVIVLSQSAQSYFRTVYGRDTRVVRNGTVSMETCSCRELERLSLRRNEYLLFVARLVPEKGLHLLIQAFQRCRTDKLLVVAGAVPDNEYGRQIQELARDCPRIRFIGFADGALLKELYSGCLAYVLPSGLEGLSLSLLEAMSAGARCIVSDIPENKAVVGDFGLSFTYPEEDSLYDRLTELLAGPEEYPRAEEQKRYIREHYSYDSHVKETEAVYQSAFLRKRNRR